MLIRRVFSRVIMLTTGFFTDNHAYDGFFKDNHAYDGFFKDNHAYDGLMLI